MSDLIIKPSGTSANFKVQNPSGTDKIVMNSSGTITTGTLGSGVTFPAGHIIETKSLSHTTSSGNSFGVAFGDALTMSNILTTEKVVIICGGGWAKFANGSYRRRSFCYVQVDYDGTTTLIKGGYSAAEAGDVDNRGAPGFCCGIWENDTGSTISTLSLKSYMLGDSSVNNYGNWNASSNYPITIIAMRCVNA